MNLYIPMPQSSLLQKVDNINFSLTQKAKAALNKKDFAIVAKDLERMVPRQSFILTTAMTGDDIREYESSIVSALGNKADYYFVTSINPRYDNERFKLEISRKIDYGNDILGTGGAMLFEISEILGNHNYSMGSREDYNELTKYVYYPKGPGIMPVAMYDQNKGELAFHYQNPKGRENFSDTLKNIRADISQLGVKE